MSSKPKFKKGDRVRAVKSFNFIRKGEMGTALEDANSPYVQWDEKHRGCYSLNGTPNVWAAEGFNLELVQAPAKKPAKRRPQENGNPGYKAAPKKAAKKAPAKKSPKKKAEPKIVKGGKRSREIVKAFEAIWADVPQPRVRIGSIVRYKEDNTVVVIMWYDESNNERSTVPDEKDWFKWGGVRLDRTNYEEGLWVTERMVENGEAEIIGHFDIYSLVNGNDKR